ncbi:MAG: DNA-processing protein DprA [Prevotella sp.]|jgi:DNA processing protein|nr:DNA-processing protein DprA [Prevotella sp.]
MEQNAKLLYRIALTKINGVGDTISRNLLNIVGDEEDVFKSSRKSLLTIPGIARKLVDAILDPSVLQRAEEELTFVEKNKIQALFIRDEDYPQRLKDCTDAPILLYYKGNSDLNAKRIVSIVGTRRATDYGSSFCEKFIHELSVHFPDILIVSGLAYGIDIRAHKSALTEKLPTVGVLAHGLDRIYPAVHRRFAVEMLENGGLLTEFPSNTEPDKFNFVRRNRIVAGMADAVVVVESGGKGGALITAEIANSYNRDVFAVPGRITDSCSEGCNTLISDNKAILLQNAENFIRQMNWSNSDSSSAAKQRQLFLDLTDDEQRIFDALSGYDSKHVNQLAVETGVPVSQLFFTLLEMEMKNIIKPLPGGTYKIVN